MIALAGATSNKATERFSARPQPCCVVGCDGDGVGYFLRPLRWYCEQHFPVRLFSSEQVPWEERT